MILLAIDPGNEQSAWVRYSTTEQRLYDFGKCGNESMLELVENHAAESPSYALRSPIAIEMIASYGMAVGREVFETCLWIGRYQQAWITSYLGAAPQLVYRRDVKLHLCGQTRANDANIRAALIDKFGHGKDKAVGTKKQPGPLYGVTADVWQALALAVTVSEQLTSKPQSTRTSDPATPRGEANRAATGTATSRGGDR